MDDEVDGGVGVESGALALVWVLFGCWGQGMDRSRSGGHPEMSGEFPQDRGSGLWDLLVGASLPSTRPTR